MTPELRAARDRLARYAGPDAPPFPPFKVGPEVASFTPGEVATVVAQIAEGIRDTLAPDVNAVLAALDQPDEPADALASARREIGRLEEKLEDAKWEAMGDDL